VKRALATPLLASAVVAAACGSTKAPAVLLDDMRTPPRSCAYVCPTPPEGCAEQTTPYACPALGPWDTLEHDDACPAWDGSYPAVTTGQCAATDASGDAVAYAGQGSGHIVLADGRWLAPSGADAVFTDLPGGLTSGLLLVPSTTLALTVDTGYDDHVVRLVDVAAIGSGSDPTLAKVQFAPPETLNSGLAYVAPDLVYVATDDGVVQALALDTANGTLVRDDARNLALPQAKDGNGNPVNWYASGLAVSPDGTKLVVASVNTTDLLVYDLAQKQLAGTVSLGKYDAYGVWFDPNDAAGSRVYVTLWEDHTVAEVDVSNPSAPSVSRTFDTQKDPQSIAFLDGRYLVVGNDLGDSLTIVDRASGTTTNVPTDGRMTLYGQEPSALAWDAAHRRLYATLAGLNAIAAWDVDTQSPPNLSFAGRLPVGYWPSAVATEPDGTVVVTNLRGHAEGPRPLYFDIGDADIGDRMHGSIERIDLPQAADLAQGDADVATFAAVASRAGEPTVSCPAGANDFPIPPDDVSGPSTRIQHVFVIVRENKGFDALFGDFPNVNGEPSYAFKAAVPGQMDVIWHNLRDLARTFAMSDNYYTQAIYSSQGHVWATFGRVNDFEERTWIVSGDRSSARPIPGGGVYDVGRPVEGSLFDWLGQNGVPYDILGEIVGSPVDIPAIHDPIDARYPGGPFQNIGYNDLEKACYTIGRIRGFCNLGNVTYMTLPNDHTFGVSPSSPTPETFCAVNDEATGMFVDGLSHSPLWATSLVMITEDDPSQGGEHVDNHRAPFVMISPFVKRGYVSHTHIDVASMHKIIANVVGKPYPNAIVAKAPIPFDAFTSTPDFTPYMYAPRTFPLACGPKGASGEKALTDVWDFSREDSQPGLDAQVTRWMHGHPLVSVPTDAIAHVRGIEARSAAR
jgi:DNA-binding beta-propeller fold protein YncE